MDDHQAQRSPAKPGLTDDELAIHPTVYAADALKDLVVVVSGGAGGIGRAIAWLFARLGALSPLSAATKASSTPLLPNWLAAT